MPCDFFEKHRDVLFDHLSQLISEMEQREKEEQDCHTTAVSSGVVSLA